MNRAFYTPGDWRRNGIQIVSVHCDADGEHETLICDLYDHHDWWRANARLIASAPQMLRALRIAQRQLAEYCSADDGRDEDAQSALRTICEAIALATGRAP